MNEGEFRRFDAVMKIVSAVGAAAVFLWGLHRYHEEQAELLHARIEAEQLARDREFRRELWMRQLDMLSRVSMTASRIAAIAGERTSTDFAQAVRDYEELYWGNVVFVDDPELTQAMDALRHELRYFEEGLEPVGNLSGEDRIKQRAHTVALASRRAIREGGSKFTALPFAVEPGVER